MKISILLLLSILVSCGAQKKTRTLEVSYGMISATQPTMVYGTKKDGSESFAKKLTSTSIDLELSNGEWDFQAITWDPNSSTLEGDPSCGESSQKLSGTDIKIDLSITKDGCKSNAWMGPNGWYQSSILIFYGTTINFCPPATTQAELSGSTNECPSYSTNISGIKVILPEHINKQPTNAGMTSNCYAMSTNTAYMSTKIPFGTNSLFPASTIIEAYYSPDVSCVGNNCCTGKVEKYLFPNGFYAGTQLINSAAPALNGSIKLKLEEVLSKQITVNGPSTASYNSCNAFSVGLLDELSNPLVATTSVGLQLNCAALCTFHTDSGCANTAIASYTIPANSSSATLYVKQTDYAAKIKVAAVNSGWLPGVKKITTTATYSAIDANYLYKPTNLSDISATGWYPPFVGNKTVIYSTSGGLRGKMQVNSVSTVAVTDDTLNYSFTTYNTNGSVAASGVSQIATACFTGNCYLDLDSNTSVSSGGAGTDAWWENLSGSLYFIPQGPVQFFLLP